MICIYGTVSKSVSITMCRSTTNFGLLQMMLIIIIIYYCDDEADGITRITKIISLDKYEYITGIIKILIDFYTMKQF